MYQKNIFKIICLGSGGEIEIVVTSTKDNKLLAVREAFQQTFGRATVTGKVRTNHRVFFTLGLVCGVEVQGIFVPEIFGLSRFLIGLCKVFTELHKPWRCFVEHLLLGQTVPQHFEASQFSACEENVQEHASMLLVACDWLVWTSAQRWCQVVWLVWTSARHWCHVTEGVTNWPWHTLQHTIFITPSCFNHSVSGVNVK